MSSRSLFDEDARARSMLLIRKVCARAEMYLTLVGVVFHLGRIRTFDDWQRVSMPSRKRITTKNQLSTLELCNAERETERSKAVTTTRRDE